MNDVIKLNEVKKIEIGILNYLDSICKKYGITYFLCAGTLLGAVRHKGFIPWDDDIDVMLFRDDYTKLINILAKQKTRYKIFADTLDDNYFYLFAKLVDSTTELYEKNVPQIKGYGVFLDIFPIDFLPDNKKKRRRLQKKILVYRRTIDYSVAPLNSLKNKGFIKFFFAVIVKIFGWKFFIKKTENMLEKLNFDNSHFVDCIVAANNPYKDIKREWFDESVNLEFEGKLYPAPKGYKNYLIALYGDYMQLPPIEKQVTHHKFIAKYKYKRRT